MIRQGLKKAKQRRFAASYIIYRSKASLFRFFHYKERGGQKYDRRNYGALNGQVFGVWFLIGAALVFWMQAGFAMVEAGFTRAKNTGNIIMKNLMDFCIGTCTFILIGFSLLLGEDMVGLIGKPGF